MHLGDERQILKNYKLEVELSNINHSHLVVFNYQENMELLADREKISQVIYNLIENAVK